jgi:RimJ/RimL family protein N-acetyltransferase
LTDSARDPARLVPVVVRRALPADAAVLLVWANDPATRAASFHPARIDAVTHERWLAERLGSPSTRLYIGLVGVREIGQVRFELDDEGSAEVSISVAPEWRGRGLGPGLLTAGIREIDRDPVFPADRLVARVRPENAASMALFRSAGFAVVGTGDDATPYVQFGRQAQLDR